ncbi:MAG: PEGA domain-containing protein [Sandaracinaceae bacterium]|nr:PEGA domain-containing protein [Sandaracinaceae bacterium]
MQGLLMQRAALACAVAITLALGFTSAASAQGDRNRARQLYAEAQALFDSGNFSAAETSFRAAYAASPNPVVLRAIATCQERQGNIRGAVETLTHYLRDAPAAPDRAAVEAHLRELSSQPGTVRVGSVPPGAEIFLDGRDTGQRTPASVSVPAGPHTIELRLAGYASASQSFTAAAATTMSLNVPMTQAAGGADPFGGQGGGSTQPVTGGSTGGSADPSAEVWITAGLSAAALISGTVFGFLALSEQSNYDAMPSQEIADRGSAFALVADISFGVALAAAATSIILYIVERPSGDRRASLNGERLRVSVAPWAAPTGGGAGLQLQF